MCVMYHVESLMGLPFRSAQGRLYRISINPYCFAIN